MKLYVHKMVARDNEMQGYGAMVDTDEELAIEGISIQGVGKWNLSDAGLCGKIDV